MTIEEMLVFLFASIAAAGLFMMDFQRRPIVANIGAVIAIMSLAAFAVVIFCLSVKGAQAHDHNRPELNSWFEELKSGKGPCCDGSDALSIDDPDWENTNGHYRVKLEGEWVNVPDEAVITEPNRDGRALVWPYRKDGKLNQVRCFLPGAGT